MDVMVYEISKPKRKAWQMSEAGAERLFKEFPGKYAIFQQLQSLQKAQKKSLTVVVEKISSKEVLNLNSQAVELHPPIEGKTLTPVLKKKRGKAKA